MKTVYARDLPGSFFSTFESRELPLVRRIVAEVKREGDRAIRRYTRLFDGVSPRRLRVEPAEMNRALREVDRHLLTALEASARLIRAFAAKQRSQFADFEFSAAPEVACGQRVIPVERAGIYVPGGRFPLVSSLLMGVIPAQVAGVREIAVCSPPGPDGLPRPSIMAAAALLGVGELYAVGGVQAVAAMAFGTATIPKVDKIAGPGNRFVTLAKKEVSGIVGIDMLAGPSEVFIVADESALPAAIAADLLAQAEHDPEAAAVLLTPSAALARRVEREVSRQMPLLATRATAAAALKRNGLIILVETIAEAAAICNRRAPEHLELQVREAEKKERIFTQYGTLFIGALAAEALGDYSSGLSHILPTGGRARFCSGLSVRDFLKLSTTLRVTRRGFARIAPAALALAEAEGLAGHARSLKIRRKRIRTP